ncbi:unnamed protein product, partial [Citrullus colocynthis]
LLQVQITLCSAVFQRQNKGEQLKLKNQKTHRTEVSGRIFTMSGRWAGESKIELGTADMLILKRKNHCALLPNALPNVVIAGLRGICG